MLHFVYEGQFDSELSEIEECPQCADDLSQQIEHECINRIQSGELGYAVMRLRWKRHWCLVWYNVAGADINLMSIRRE